ncbi:TIM21-domain-containing protein [Lentinula aciculospora]|uniref:Mitochondrial import inner membrane translocase subunit Tim21 n=1 Tax=Lentinula aciculospora TaxID=153920 RepID=A0A9W9A977_9AGAR|nr:TIM21-domain-containing protein [Lentinula aciculospora]
MTSLFCRAHASCPSFSRISKPRISVFRLSRRYATHKDPLHPSQLSQSLDTKYQPLRPDQKVGPFQMRMNESPFATPKPTRWVDLSTGGKIKRTTARTTNLIVIVFGAGLTAVLLYAVTSELFSKNSPTVLYGESCEKIKASPQVEKYLRSPLTFHMTPPSTERPRGRQHQVASQIFMDSSGHERMILSFFVSGSSRQSEDSYYDSATTWISETAKHLPELTMDDAIQVTKDRSVNAWEKFVQSFKYLIGAPAPPSSVSDLSSSSSTKLEAQPRETESRTQKWTGIFSSLRRTRSESTTDTARSSEVHSTVYMDGEAHAEFIRNDDGYFVCRYIFIDLPNSRTRNPLRIFVERTAGVRENEAVIRRHS